MISDQHRAPGMTRELDAVGHTPGPWTVRTLENFGFNVVHYINGDKFDIARVAKCSDEANARLIAAAPETLAALRDACDEIKDLRRYANNHGGMYDEEEYSEGLAAISKAEGRTP